MRKKDLSRRRLIFNNPISGTLRTANGTDKIDILDSAGAPLNTLTIKGKTIQPIEDRGLNMSEYFKTISNYSSAGVAGCYYIALPSEWVGVNMTYMLLETNKTLGVTVDLADSKSALYSNKTPLLSADGTLSSYTGDEYSYLMVGGIIGDDVTDENGDIIHVLTELSELWENHSLSAVAPICLQIDTPILNAGNSGIALTLDVDGTKRMIEFPKTVSVSGKNVTLLMSEFDSVRVDLKSRTVTYEEGSYQKSYNGIEGTSVYGAAMTAGYGVFFKYSLSVAAESNVGYNTRFPLEPWTSPPPRKDNIFSINANQLYIKTDQNDTGLTNSQMAQRASAFKTQIRNLYIAGSPMKILLKRKVALTHDISNSDLGRALLSILVPRGKNGTLSASGIGANGISATYYSMSQENEEKRALMIRYLDENGVEILSPKTHSVRLGSKYQIIVPHISGYTRTGELYEGVAQGETEVNLIYKEAE